MTAVIQPLMSNADMVTAMPDKVNLVMELYNKERTAQTNAGDICTQNRHARS